MLLKHFNLLKVFYVQTNSNLSAIKEIAIFTKTINFLSVLAISTFLNIKDKVFLKDNGRTTLKTHKIWEKNPFSD